MTRIKKILSLVDLGMIYGGDTTTPPLDPTTVPTDNPPDNPMDDSYEYMMVSNIMKTKHDTAKNVINNVR